MPRSTFCTIKDINFVKDYINKWKFIGNKYLRDSEYCTKSVYSQIESPTSIIMEPKL